MDVGAIEASRQGPARYAAWLGIEAIEGLGSYETPLLAGTGAFADVAFKVEGVQPTGSFKDRGCAVLAARLSELGLARAVEDSSGNAGASLAAHCARAGIALRLFVPESAPPAKLVQAEVHGAEIVRVPGSRSATTDAAVEFVDAERAVYASHLWNPYFILGVKTFAFEVWEQLGQRPPDAVVVPVGAGSLLIAAYRAFSSLRKAGLTARMPRLFGVQVAAFAPLALASEAGSDQSVDVPPANSAADGILVADPPRGSEALAAARATGGAIVAVSEDALWEAHRALAKQGLFVEPTSAVASAGARMLRLAGQLAPGEETVVVLSGHGLKSAALGPGDAGVAPT